MTKNTLKRIFALLLTVFIISGLAVSVSAEEPVSENDTTTDDASLGDVNSDGRLTASDARILLRCASQLQEADSEILTKGDFDKDGRITAADARVSLRIACGIDSIICILTDHEFSPSVYAPTCTSDGYTTKKCTRCTATDGSVTDTIPATGHRLNDTITPPTCTKAGHLRSKCEVCGFVAVDREDGKPTGHIWADWVTGKTEKTRKCKMCGITETEKLPQKKDKVIYLTFDDGPGPYTEKLLRYLREYDVKATFFVTNQNPGYAYLLKTMAKDGHAIGVHTLTHNWNIYSSEAKYMQDFNAMHKIIKDRTGIDTKLFRFPGGTNNTVSRSYSKGIMTKLANSMVQKGYYYFDWNVDCYDTSGYNSTQIANTTIYQISNRKVSVVLMHDIKNSTVEAVPRIIRYGLKNGYSFEVLDETSPAIRFAPAN